MVQWLILHFQNPRNWFHVKSEWYRNRVISTLCYLNWDISFFSFQELSPSMYIVRQRFSQRWNRFDFEWSRANGNFETRFAVYLRRIKKAKNYLEDIQEVLRQESSDGSNNVWSSMFECSKPKNGVRVRLPKDEHVQWP